LQHVMTALTPCAETTVRFGDLELRAWPRVVMVPRATTERLVGEAVGLLDGGPSLVADVGTGSGAIALVLAARVPLAEVWAIDTSADAISLATANARRLGLDDRVHALVGDLLDGAPDELDLVVANLPYLPDRLAADPDYADLADEPHDAVFAPGDGLGHYRRLLRQAKTRLSPAGSVLLQYRGDVFGASRDELDELLAELEASAPAQRIAEAVRVAAR
jgi:release factor glutamine methyltransferase